MATPEQIQIAMANAQAAGDQAAVARLSAALGRVRPQGVPIGQPNLYAGPKAAADLANTQAGTARTQQDMKIDAAKLALDKRNADIAEQRLRFDTQTKGREAADAALAKKDADAARASELRQLVRTAKLARGLTQRAVGIEGILENYQPTTGPVGALLSYIPGTVAYDFDTDLDTVRSNVGFDRLAQMRAQSPTGGALGSVTKDENVLLQSTLSPIRQSVTTDKFKQNLGTIADEYEQRLVDKGVRGGMIGGGRTAPRPAAPSGAPKRIRFEDLP